VDGFISGWQTFQRDTLAVPNWLGAFSSIGYWKDVGGVPDFSGTCDPRAATCAGVAVVSDLQWTAAPRDLPWPEPPSFRWRLPDFYSVSLSVPIPTPWTGTLISWTFSASLDRYGNYYYSNIGPGIGKAATVFSGSLTGEWLQQDRMPDAGQLSDFLSGDSWNASAGFWGGVVGSWSPGNGTAVGFGVVSPQLGANYAYTFQGSTNTGITW